MVEHHFQYDDRLSSNRQANSDFALAETHRVRHQTIEADERQSETYQTHAGDNLDQHVHHLAGSLVEERLQSGDDEHGLTRVERPNGLSERRGHVTRWPGGVEEQRHPGFGS